MTERKWASAKRNKQISHRKQSLKKKREKGARTKDRGSCTAKQASYTFEAKPARAHLNKQRGKKITVVA